jgi:putative ABC transport system permease protein
LEIAAMSNALGVDRRSRPLVWLDELARDVRHALRTLATGRSLPLAAVVTLALAIGSSIAMFSVLNAVLLEPLPYRAADRLAMVWTEDLSQGMTASRSALADVERWRNQSRAFEDLATFDGVARTLTAPEGAEQIIGAGMSSNLLAVLGVQPVRGRGFASGDAEQGVVLIGHRFWHERFGGSNDAIGATLILDGVPAEIIGVLPADFGIATVDADVWHANAMAPPGEVGQDARGGATWFAVGRLRATATFAEALTELRAIAARLNAELPAVERNRSVAVEPLSHYVVGPESRLALWMLGGAVLFVFLIAVANVASLSLARSVARAREMAVRAALGASGARLVRQVLTESVLLAVAAGLIGTLLAAAAIRLIRTFGPVDWPRLGEMSLDLRAAGWAAVISLLAGILVGLAPAIMTLRAEWRSAAKGSGRGTTGSKATSRIRRGLVMAEFAISIVLLIGAGLLVRSLSEVNGVDPGFRPERVLAMRIAMPAGSNEPAQRSALYDRVLEQIRAVPGVENVGMIGDLWIANDREQTLTAERADGTVTDRVRFRRDEVSADFFAAIGTPLLQGRFFSNGDGPEATRVAIVNETLARQSWPGQDAVGRRFKFGPADSAAPWFTVVGVVGDMRRQGPERDAVPQMFEALAQNPPRGVEVFVRTSTDDPFALAGRLRAAVRSVERNAPIYAVAPLEQQFGNYLAQRQFQTALLTGFSLMALLLAGVGIYGLIEYSIATRTHEIGLRMAVGAHAGHVLRLVLSEGLTLCVAGLALGLVGAWWLARAASSLLFGVTAGDPLTFVSVSLLLTAVALAACYFPARRAAGLDPMVALRTT